MAGGGKILVSACLLGQPVRYNGAGKPLTHPTLARWQAEGRVVSVCPEVMAGFAIPRAPAEIADGADGEAVLRGAAKVIDTSGADVTAPFVEGAKIALALARQQGCAYALLIDGSPSCGSNLIYNGSFSGAKHSGAGVTTAFLRANGVEVFSEAEIETLEARLGE